ncbi:MULTISPECIES: GerMN domain-containing protein [unclassified Microbacterium]|uniref:GerMN domain-containing protein n=1 Tax=unclassified Microbacterium TaxID=2609290 RepID=UPI00214C332A|nr:MULTISPECIES: GerMN domain-containing protein [unclassified Microbacterium]MCR2785250.1 LpqB family beta-propeller domain-containing protein [Microbacterium sp. zg.B96]WIM16780.1 LpqB family beta-propeller domain-containing protein [Microbacterium sp. zg-B96]
MRRPFRFVAVAVAAASAMILSACAGLPTSGPVNPGLERDRDARPPDITFVADPPQPGATPREIVEGFIRAGSGTRGEWATAREYLTEGAREVWNPFAGVTIDDFADREYVEVAEDEIMLNVTAEATVDQSGAYHDVGGEGQDLPFRLAQEDGQWRISEAPNGIVLDDARFEDVFRSYPLAYFDPSWNYLVPDVRWFTTTNPATSIASALLEGGPSPWLEGAVATAVTGDVLLAARTVPVQDDGTAQIELTAGALDLDRTTLDRLQTQLVESLAGAGVSQVQLTVDGQPLAASVVATTPTRVPQQPLVLADEGFGFLAGDTLEPLALSDAVVDAAPVAVQVAADHEAAALLRGTGTVARVDTAAGWADVDTRAGLIAPTIDTAGWVWSVPRSVPGALQAFGPEGEIVQVAGAWPDATGVTAMAVSRDGTRVAALVQGSGGPAVWVAGIIREGAVPVRLGEPHALASLAGTGVAVAWLDATHLGIVVDVAGDSQLVEQIVGGAGTALTAPAGVTTIAPTNQASVPRLLDAQGNLYVLRGTNWGKFVTGVPGIRVLATAQGMPR